MTPGVGTWEGGGWGREMRAHVINELLLQPLHVGFEDFVLFYHCRGLRLTAALISVACAGIEMPVHDTQHKYKLSFFS
jgi:hypothetical protein